MNEKRASALKKVNSSDSQLQVEGIRELALYGQKGDLLLLKELQNSENFVIQIEAGKALEKLEKKLEQERILLEKQLEEERRKEEERKRLEKLLTPEERERIRQEELRRLEEIKRRKEEAKLKEKFSRTPSSVRKVEVEKVKLEEKKMEFAQKYREEIRKQELEKLGLVEYNGEFYTKEEYEKIKFAEKEKERKRKEAIERKFHRMYLESKSRMEQHWDSIKNLEIIFLSSTVVLIISLFVLFLVALEIEWAKAVFPVFIFLSIIATAVSGISGVFLYNNFRDFVLDRILTFQGEDRIVPNNYKFDFFLSFLEKIFFHFNPKLKKKIETAKKYG